MAEYINCFPGYEKVIEWKQTPEGTKKIVHNMYRGTDLGLGGYVYFEPLIYRNLVLLDVSNMHGLSIIALNKFGKHTPVFADIREANLAIKHKEFDRLKTIMGGKLAKYVDDPNTDWKALRAALKLVSNSTYGIADATFENPLRDSRDDNNIVALRGALFMRTLQDEVKARGFTVAHIKTDSIKIPDATPEIVQFCMDFGKKYGYEFEFEAVYEKFCLVNGSTYVAKHMSTEECQRRFNYIPGENREAEESGMLWTATAAQFQQPYVFKTLFSHEPIEFKDMCETKSVKTQLYLDFNEGLPDVSEVESAITKIEKAQSKLCVLWDEAKGSVHREEEAIQKDARAQERMIEKSESYLRSVLGEASFNLDLLELVEAAKKYAAQGHRRQFIGGVGLFCPVKDGTGGGVLVRSDGNGGFTSVTGTKKQDKSGVYRWKEAEVVKATNSEADINEDYYRVLVDDAVKAIEEQCEAYSKLHDEQIDFDWFAS